MKIPPESIPKGNPNDHSDQTKEIYTQEDEIPAWEPATEDLWIPYRIRGSWRGRELG